MRVNLCINALKNFCIFEFSPTVNSNHGEYNPLTLVHLQDARTEASWSAVCALEEDRAGA